MRTLTQKLRANPIWLARIMALVLLYVNVLHQQMDFGGSKFFSWTMAFAFEASIMIAISAIVAIIWTGESNLRFAILLFLPVVYFGAQASVDASTRAFMKSKHEQVEWERKGVAGTLASNAAISAANRVNALEKEGILTGALYDNAVKLRDEKLAALEEKNALIKTGGGETSASIKAIQKGDGSVDVDEQILGTAKLRALILLGFASLFAAASGIWAMIAEGFNKSSDGVMQETKSPKKPQGAHPRPEQ